MEVALSVASEFSRYMPPKEPRRHSRTQTNLRVVVADGSGLGEGQVRDLSPRGCGLRLSKRLTLGQYLWIKIHPEIEGTAPLCDLVRVKWIAEDQAGVEFLFIPPDRLGRLHTLLAVKSP